MFMYSIQVSGLTVAAWPWGYLAMPVIEKPWVRASIALLCEYVICHSSLKLNPDYFVYNLFSLNTFLFYAHIVLRLNIAHDIIVHKST